MSGPTFLNTMCYLNNLNQIQIRYDVLVYCYTSNAKTQKYKLILFASTVWPMFFIRQLNPLLQALKNELHDLWYYCNYAQTYSDIKFFYRRPDQLRGNESSQFVILVPSSTLNSLLTLHNTNTYSRTTCTANVYQKCSTLVSWAQRQLIDWPISRFTQHFSFEFIQISINIPRFYNVFHFCHLCHFCHIFDF